MSSDIQTLELTVPVPFRYLGNPKKGIEDKLNGLLSQYVAGADGILTKWADLAVLDDKGIILDDQPYSFWKISFTAYLFKPSEGKLLKGQVHKIQKLYLIVRALDSLNVTVSIPEKLLDHPVVKRIMVEKEVYFKIKGHLEGVYRGELDLECLELTETMFNQEMDEDVNKGIYDYADDFEY